METEHLILVVAVYLFAGFVKGFSGLGFSAISIGILASFIELTTAIPLVVIPSTASSLLVVLESGGFSKAVNRFWPMYIAAFPGLAIGIWLLVGPEDQTAKTTLGILLLAYAAWALSKPSFRLSAELQKKLNAPVGFLTGFFSGLTGVAVMPVSPYLLSLGLAPEMFVQTLNVSFLISSTVLIIALGGLGFLDTPTLVISVLAILPVAVAVKAGVLLRRRVSEKGFRTVVLFVLLLLGLNLVAFT